MLKQLSAISILLNVFSFVFSGPCPGFVWAADLSEIQMLRAEIQKVEAEYKQQMTRIRVGYDNTLRALRNRLKLLESQATHASIDTFSCNNGKERKKDASERTYFIQIGAYGELRNVRIGIHKLEECGFHAIKLQRVQIRGSWLTRVMVGPCATRREAAEATERLRRHGITILLRREYIRPAKRASPQVSVRREERTEIPETPPMKRTSGLIEVMRPQETVSALRSQTAIEPGSPKPIDPPKKTRKFMQKILGIDLTQMNDSELQVIGSR